MFILKPVIFLFLLLNKCFTVAEGHGTVSKQPEERSSSRRAINYLFYEVNPPEGFNLRRDVFIRMAILVSKLQDNGNWVLVLPPWPHLYHWQSHIAQNRLPWSHFFNLADIRKFVPVIDMLDFLDMHPDGVIERAYVLQNFDEMFKTGNFVEKYETSPCTQEPNIRRDSDGFQLDSLPEVTARKVDCLSYHGVASFITPLLTNFFETSVMLDHAEILLHDSYGDATYWRARRSMRFSRMLETVAADFRKEHLHYTDSNDDVLPADWVNQKPHRRAIGGDYVGVHLRRRDFLHARRSDTPSLKGAVAQIKSALKRLNLNIVFVATDSSETEKKELRKLCHEEGITMVSFEPSKALLDKIKDGGVAIVDQIICSHARYFIGSYESTFSFRIQEEREILGFRPETTFNRFCGDEQSSCRQPTQWLIKY